MLGHPSVRGSPTAKNYCSRLGAYLIGKALVLQDDVLSLVSRIHIQMLDAEHTFKLSVEQVGTYRR